MRLLAGARWRAAWLAAVAVSVTAVSAVSAVTPVSAGASSPAGPVAGTLAIATDRGMVLWQAGHVRRVGPSVPAGSATDVLPAWSPDGRYLAWAQEGTRTDIEVADLHTGRTRRLAIAVAPVSLAVTDGGAVNAVENGSTAVYLAPGRPARTYGPKFVDVGAATVSGLYDLVMSGSSFDLPVVEHYTLSGQRRQVVVLPRLATGAPPYEQGWATADGATLVVEHGDHTDVCGVGPTSTLTTVSSAGRTHLIDLPPLAGEVQRVVGLTFGPAGSFDVTLLECGAHAGDPTWPSRVVDHRDGRWQVVGGGLLAGSASPAGVQAVAEGRFVDHGSGGPVAVPEGGAVLVAGHAVAGLPGPATDVAWSPG